MQPTGLHVPIVTPFTAAGAVDLVSLERLARDLLDRGADGLVALGTTGEPATLTTDEKRTVVEVAGGVCRDRGAMFTVGAGGSGTDDSVRCVRELRGTADFALVPVPLFTTPPEAGVVEHFRRVSEEGTLPVIVYDVPHRTGRPLSLGTLLELSRLDAVVGFKHSIGAVTETTAGLLAAAPADVCVLAGDDPLVGAVLALGGHGAISACANVATERFAHLIAAWREGRVDEARTVGRSLTALSTALFAEPNPTVVKGVLAAQGRIASPTVRLPQLPASRAAVAAAVDLAGSAEL
ncbi:4-hydroxy-tetrahydrodipicolinate synthase [Tsukamurella serpentis]